MTTPDTWTPDHIKALRASLGLTQVQMTRALGYSAQPSYAALEGGQRSALGPTSRLLDLYAEHGRALAEPYLADDTDDA